LTSFKVTGLAAGTATENTISVSMPGAPGAAPSPFQEPDRVFVGLRVDAQNEVVESNENNNGDQHQGVDFAALNVVSPATAGGTNATLAVASSLAVNSRLTAGIAAAAEKRYFKLILTDPGRLTARLQGTGDFQPAISLLGPDGQILAQSESQAGGQGGDNVNQYLTAGTYFLAVRAGSANPPTGKFQPPTPFSPSSYPLQPPLLSEEFPMSLAVGDLNRSGALGFCVNGAIYTGQGDGGFVAGPNPAGLISTITSGDYNGDGRLDFVARDHVTGELAVFQQQKDGTFQ